MKTAFISYSVADKIWVGHIKSVLEKHGVKCFLAHEDLLVSEEWRESIIKALKGVDIFIAILSKNFKSSKWCSQEVGYIVSKEKVAIIPLSIDGTTPYGFISKLQGNYVRSESEIDGILHEALFRKFPRQMISAHIKRMNESISYHGAESVTDPAMEFRI